MAHVSNLPCDGDGRCMVCKINPPEEETINCKTCVTPWHVDCLSARPQTLAEASEWECPDCSDLVSSNAPPCAVASGSEPSAALVAAIRAIESDVSLSDHEKAVRRQKLLSGKGSESSDDKKEIDNGGGNDVLKLLSGSFNCSFCMQLPERPVTTPCGHNFCLKCFEKWVGQGKRTCAICRTSIPVKMASQPRINSSLVVAIRMAKMTRSNAASGPPKPYYSILNQNKPDKAYTTERAKKTGNANACSGRIFVSVPPDHFGPILAENDLERGMGVMVGETWEDRLECRQWGAHRPHVAGICGQSDYGAQSVALSGGYEDDEDHGEWFLYTGSGGRDLSGNKRTNKKQSFDQKFDKSNEALRVSCKKGYPVRVVRSHKEKRSAYAPEQGVRYDGVYRIEKCWRKPGIQGYKVCRYLFVRCDNDPAPWTSDEIGDRPRPLPVIKELKDASDVTERKGPPSWDYDEEKGCWLWKIPPPESRIKTDQRDAGDGTTPRVVRHKTQMMSANALLLKEFCCLICHKVMNLPLTTPCAHNFCKACLQNAFAGQTFIKERNCEGRRTLRAKKNVMKCPSCPNDISEYLQNAQVNRELMSVIESLQRETKEMEETAVKEEAADKDVKTDVNEMEETATKEVAADKEEKTDVNEMEETTAKEESADKDEKADVNEMEEETAAKEEAVDKEEKTNVIEMEETAAKEEAANKDEKADVNEMEETAAKEEAANKDERADVNEKVETAAKEEAANKDEKADVNEMEETAAKEEAANKDERADVNEKVETAAKEEAVDKDEKTDVNEMEETTTKEEATDKEEKTDVNEMEETATKEEGADKDEKAVGNEMEETATKEEAGDKDEKADVNEMEEETAAKKEDANKDEKADVNEMEETAVKEEAADKDEKADVNDEGKYRNKRKAEDVTDNDSPPNKKPHEENDTLTDGFVNVPNSQIIKGDDVEMQENFKEEER